MPVSIAILRYRDITNNSSSSDNSNGITGSSSAGNTTPKTASAKFTEAGKHLGKAAEQAGRMSGSGHSVGGRIKY
ncbi:MAG TPA: hypothetical protein PLP75_13495 [Burkholderiales bacterium]|nr:hypothetical protein [Burkholderiales bacterium]